MRVHCRHTLRGIESAAMVPDVSFADPDLVSNIKQGDKQAEAALYQKYSDRLYFLALSELHSREDAEDVRAETFTRVLIALREGKLRKPESLTSFMVGIALNVIRESRRQQIGTEPLPDQDLRAASDPSPEKVFLDQEVRQSIRELAKHLKPREQDFLRMYFFEERSNREIALVLGIKEERLRLIKSRTLKKFREIIRNFRAE